MSFNEQDRFSAELRGQGWLRLALPQTVRCYVGSIWMDAYATEVNSETREIRIEYPVVTRGLRHFILDASQYEHSDGLFKRENSAPLAGVAT
jgi:hypothetical protein